MGNRWEERRKFLQLAAGAMGASALPPGVAKALSLPAARVTGTIADVQHVVILMQENRSFDHYFGTMRGVRGYGDPRPIALPGGQSVWKQPARDGASTVSPFHLDTASTRAETMFSLDHSWKGSHARWKHHDAWVPAKGPLTMGYFTRADLPFYYALADAFTVCDAYHCSIFGPTNPNRLFLFTGTSGLAAGDDSKIVITNPPEEKNETADPAKDSPEFKGLAWPTYAERLQAAGVSWGVYQEYDNYGDNGLSYFANFRGIGPDSTLYRRGRAWSPGSNADNAKASDGEHLVAQFAADVAADRLPQVSWIVPPYKLSEHPQASPSDGAYLTARLIAALAANPKVWAKTVFILNYDENDGFFDHVPPPIPPAGAAQGKSTVATDHEDYHGEPVGLGPRVPMIVVSPWSKGGYVSSELLDHTSVIRFLEARFGVMEPHISPWRRAVCGDLTGLFDFKTPNRAPAPLPDASGLPPRAAKAKALPFPKVPAEAEAHPRQEPGQRPARALPYEFQVATYLRDGGLELTFANTGKAGVVLHLYQDRGGEPRFYTIGRDGYLTDHIPLESGPHAFSMHGPNGFLRSYKGEMRAAFAPAANGFFLPKEGKLRIGLHNEGSAPVTLEIKSVAYIEAPPRLHRLTPGASVMDDWDLSVSHNWYDFIVTCAEAPSFQRRLAGHFEDGKPSVSDPLLGRQA
ncbi:MAG TPA: phospholipase C, phosphocholine-specific [Phenylobacterium sp.]|uniref:phosphocholine-specific phospholipase C n=1 Tax=Phenylobacterium sp. TaxID=1871053 RepID=UPI002BE63477|nr:phospholipase C, phosphocholine-specific [Phenylobacterium sp.]HXA38905.1 phospholipase C, phosphocholine-specific [Phenylobacterium sp.]